MINEKNMKTLQIPQNPQNLSYHDLWQNAEIDHLICREEFEEAEQNFDKNPSLETAKPLAKLRSQSNYLNDLKKYYYSKTPEAIEKRKEAEKRQVAYLRGLVNDLNYFTAIEKLS
jgi:ribosomal protein S21